MQSRAARFNIYLVTLAACWLAGCETTGSTNAGQTAAARRKEEGTLFRVHLETTVNHPERTLLAPVYRDHALLVKVDKTPFLHEGLIAQAALVELPQGLAIRIQYDRQGTALLENMSTSYRGRRIAIVSEFGDKRWLAAPVLSHRITDGVLLFQPDASREEADRIVRGLNNLVRELRKMK